MCFDITIPSPLLSLLFFFLGQDAYSMSESFSVCDGCGIRLNCAYKFAAISFFYLLGLSSRQVVKSSSRQVVKFNWSAKSKNIWRVLREQRQKRLKRKGIDENCHVVEIWIWARKSSFHEAASKIGLWEKRYQRSS